VSESRKHRRIKGIEAGKGGKTETKLPGGKLLDVATGPKAVEVQTTVTPKELLKAARRLRASAKPQKVLVVPKPKDVPAAARAMRQAKVGGTARTPRRPGRPPAKVAKVKT